MPENLQEQEIQNTNHDRRAVDAFLPILIEIKSDVQAIRTELGAFKQDVNKAFLKDDEGIPDYAAHRAFHLKEKKHAERIDEYTTDFTKKMLAWLGISVISVIATALVFYLRSGKI